MCRHTQVTRMRKPPRNFWQIWNMSFGFLGIQFGWGLQMANMSAIYEYLGARADQIPILWLAAPLTGLLVQPLIGHASDHTWGRLGRRRPYFLAGAILSSLALLLMPRVGALWMAAGLLWVLDASINISMEPFRAFVADMLPEEQRTRGFAMQSLMIGLGAVLASAMPWILTNLVHLRPDTSGLAIPATVRLSFYMGAAAFFGAVLWTILTTKEYPPEDLEAFRKKKSEKRGLGECGEILIAIKEMPPTMRQLAPVQFLTWLGLFCMWLYFAVAVARNVFGATDPKSQLYTDGVAWGGICFAFYSGVCFVFSFFLPSLAKALGAASHPQPLVALRCSRLALRRRHPRQKSSAALHDRRRHRVGQHSLHALLDSRGFFAAGAHRRVHGHLQLLHRHAGDRRLAGLRLGDVALVEQQPPLRGDCRRRLPHRRGRADAARHRSRRSASEVAAELQPVDVRAGH